MQRALFLSFFAALLLLGSGCSTIEFRARDGLRRIGVPERVIQPHRPPNFWRGDEMSGSPSIVVDLSEQEAYFFKGKRLAGESQISTGRIGFETPAGSYKVIQKDEHHVSNLYGDYVDGSGTVVKSNVDARKGRKPPGSFFRGARMPYFMRIKGGYGMHAGYLPGFRASHGCIRMPADMAAHFYYASRIGTPVRVRE